MATKLIWFVGTPDMADQLIAYVGKSMGDERKTFVADCTALVKASGLDGASVGPSYFDLIEKLVAASPNVFSGNAKDEADIEGCFAVLCTLLIEVEGKQQALVDTLCKALTAQVTSPVMRLRTLTNLYNQIPSEAFELRYGIFWVIVDYAAKAKQLPILRSFLTGISDRVKTWQMEPAAQRQLYLKLASLHSAAGLEDTALEYLDICIRTLESCTDVAILSSAAIKDAAAKVMVRAVKSIDVRQDVSLIHLPAVQQLKGDATYGKLYELLHIFVTDKLPAYTAFYDANKEYVTSLGVDYPAAVENMRLLSLCSLALEHDQIPYTVVAEILQVPIARVEEYVLKAITMELIDARMDQLKEVIIVHSAMNRSFGMDQWKIMQKRLHAWKDQVETLLDVIKHRRRTSGMA